MVPKTQDAKAGTLESMCSDPIFCCELLMLATVYFYDNLFRQANKVENVTFKWMQPAKLQSSQLPAVQQVPELSLSIGHISPQSPLEAILQNGLVCLTSHGDPSPP
jgi:hypothetical protein